ncbi:MAG: NrfD/PsrC family molybdoenzyme membrane anchor subunit [bacterium JZ-2024 1]
MGENTLAIIGATIMAGLAVSAFRILTGRFIPGYRNAVWWVFLVVLWGSGGVALVTRFTRGLGAMTHLSDTFPWGIWVAFDVLCGVALAAGGFLVAGAVYIFRLKKFHAVLRPSILTAYLGYLLVVGGLLVDLGRPYNIWHPLVYWQHHSVMFEVGWCVALYTTVLTIEFLPILLERMRWEKPLALVRSVTIPVVMAGIILSTLHQSSLGALFLIVPNKLLPLWYSPLLPLFFLLSAVAGGMAMVIIESALSARAFKKSLEMSVIQVLASGMAIVLSFYLILRLADVTFWNGWVAVFQHPMQGFTFLVEMLLFCTSVFLVLGIRGNDVSRKAIGGAVFTVLGIILNRLNVAWFGMIPAAGVWYVPSWQEVAITINLLSYGIVVFALAARYLPLYEPHNAGTLQSGEPAVSGSGVAT